MVESCPPSPPTCGRSRAAAPRHFKPSKEVVAPSEGNTAEKEIIDPKEIHINNLIGSGSTADVYRGTLRGQSVAVKKMTRIRKLNVKEEVSFSREVEVLSKIDHVNLVRFYGVVLSPRPYQIVTEFCEGGNVFELVYNTDVELTWGQRMKMVIDIARAMSYLHGCDPPIIHRDLKSLNLLLAQAVRGPEDPVCVKVTDFGLSKMTGETEEKMTRRVGTLQWMAPEMYTTQTYDEKVDIYSYSMVLFEIISGEPPFDDIEDSDIEKLVAQGERPDLEAVPPDCPPELRSTMVSCWAQDPAQRPSFPTILKTLLAIDRSLKGGSVISAASAWKQGDIRKVPGGYIGNLNCALGG